MRPPDFGKLPPVSREHVRVLTEIVKETDKFLLRVPSISDFCIWHATVLGRLSKILNDEPGTLDAWKSFDLVSLTNKRAINQYFFEAREVGLEDKLLNANMEPNIGPNSTLDPDLLKEAQDRIAELNVDEYVESAAAVLEARRILFDYIALVSGADHTPELATLPNRLDIGFIDDPRLRRVCIGYYQEAYKSLLTGCYVGCAILLGSLLEGVLYSVASQRVDDAKAAISASKNSYYRSFLDKPIERWELEVLIAVATHNRWISKHGDHLALVVRWHRNYVHPRQMTADSRDVDKTSARLLVNAVEFCIRDINDWLKQEPAAE